MHPLAFINNLFTGADGIIILIIVLVIFGPKKLPELARGMGQAIREFHKAKDEIQRELTTTNEVNVQPAPGQQPRQPAQVVTVAPVAPATQVTPLPPPQAAAPAQPSDFSSGTAFENQQPARPVEQTHPAGEA